MITREAIDAFPATSANYADIFRLIGEFESLLQFDEICLGLSKRVAVAVSTEWQTVEDSVRFWSADYGDDQLTKLLLMKKLQLAQQAVLWIQIRSRIRSDSKLFSGSGVGSGINNFGSGSGQPLTRMNLKHNFSDKIHNFSAKCIIK
jgi:hypothetical protein